MSDLNQPQKSATSGSAKASVNKSSNDGSNKWIYLIPLVIFILMVVLLASGLGKDPTKLDSTLIGKPLPQFNKKLLVATEKFSLEQTVSQDDLQGPALINIFASWCPSCYFEHPDLMKLAQANAVTIYGINYKDKREAGLKFINDLGNPYNMIIFDRNGRLGIDLGVYGAPETFVLDANNKIIYRHVGVVTQEVWNDLLRPMLNLDKSELEISGGYAMNKATANTILTFVTTAFVIIALSLSLNSAASIQVYQFDDKQNELRFNKLVQELRCPKCQNNNLADSNSALSIDLKTIIYEKIHAGESDQQIVDYLRQRYGDFISYRPPVTPSTWFIWFGPFILLAAGCFAVFRFLNKPQRAKPQPTQAESSAQSQALFEQWSSESEAEDVNTIKVSAKPEMPESKD